MCIRIRMHGVCVTVCDCVCVCMTVCDCVCGAGVWRARSQAGGETLR